jgi:hypothetical protein
MVRLEEYNIEVDDNLDDFYRDSERFKKMKLLIDFEMLDIKAENPSMQFTKPKLKKPQRAATYIKPDANKKSLF